MGEVVVVDHVRYAESVVKTLAAGLEGGRLVRLLGIGEAGVMSIEEDGHRGVL